MPPGGGLVFYPPRKLPRLTLQVQIGEAFGVRANSRPIIYVEWVPGRRKTIAREFWNTLPGAPSPRFPPPKAWHGVRSRGVIDLTRYGVIVWVWGV